MPQKGRYARKPLFAYEQGAGTLSNSEKRLKSLLALSEKTATMVILVTEEPRLRSIQHFD